MLFEKDAAGLAQKSYTRGLGFPGGIGGLVSMKRYEMGDDGLGEKTHYYHYDALGSVRGLSDGQGKLKAPSCVNCGKVTLRIKRCGRNNRYCYRFFKSRQFTAQKWTGKKS